MTRLSADAAFAGLAELARLGASDAPPATLAELAGPILMRITGAPAVRLSVDSGLAKQVLFNAWPDEADLWRSRLSLPMVAGSRVIGLIECAAPKEGAFDASVRQLVEASALVLARLVGTAATELTQNVLELRTLQRVAETVSRTLDLDDVLGRCLEMALQVAHAPAGAIYLRDGQRGVYRRCQQRNVPEEVAPQEVPVNAIDPRFASSAAQVLDLDNTEERNAILDAARRHGFKRIIFLPLRAEERLVGLLGLDFFSSATFVPSTIMTLEAIAGQEAIAIENARVHRQSELRARLASTLRHFAERALSTLDQHELYRLILEASCKLARGDRALISQIVDEGKTVRVVAGLGKDERLVGMDIPTSAPYIRETFEQVAMIVEETASLPPGDLFAQVARQNETASFALFLMRYRDQPLGHVFSGSGELRRYEPAEIEAMQTLAAMSAEVLERARAQKEVENERERLDAIIDHMPIVMAVIDKSGAVSHLNRAGREFSQHFGAEKGLSRPDWTAALSRIRTCTTDGKPVPFEDLQVVRAFRGEQPGPRELLLTDHDGNQRMYVMAVAAPLFGPDGKTVEQVVTAFQDVSALRQLADAKDRFLRVASHELRSPITSLRATTSLLEMDPAAVADPERRAVMLQRIHRQVDRLIKLVEQLLDSARLNAEQVPIQVADAEMGQLVEEAITLAGSSPADRARVRIDQPGPVRGRWDPLRIEQVLTNLLTNALRYSPATAPVVVRLTDADPVRIEVIDQGIGIPPHQLDQVFSPFFRGANAQAQHKGGLGLGLHITAEIVRRHGGNIHVQSELGRGSTFTVELPRHGT